MEGKFLIPKVTRMNQNNTSCGARKLDRIAKNSRIPLFVRSFASHEKVKHCSHLNTCHTRSGFKSSHRQYLFNCDNEACKHTFKKVPYNIVKGSWCPYCMNRKLCPDDDCRSSY